MHVVIIDRLSEPLTRFARFGGEGEKDRQLLAIRIFHAPFGARENVSRTSRSRNTPSDAGNRL